MKKLYLLFSLCASFFLLNLPKGYTQEDLQNRTDNIIIHDSLYFYGNARTLTAYYDENIEVQDNVSWIGFKVNKGVLGHKDIAVIAHFEWGVNIVDNNVQLNANGGSPNADSFFDDKDDPFTTRQGYLGVKLAKYGELILGKRWGVYYDVAGVTDNFNVFGGQASGTYNPFTDGGLEGTGRAAKAIMYRNKIGNLGIGLQTQLNGSSENYAACLHYNFPNGLLIGSAVNFAEFVDELDSLSINVSEHEYIRSLVVGVRYQTDRFYGAITYMNANDELFVGSSVLSKETEDQDVQNVYILPAQGLEIYLRYRLTRHFDIYGGINYLDPKDDPLSVGADADTKLEYYVIAGEYRPVPDVFIYSEVKFSNSVTTNGSEDPNVYTIGITYNFNWSLSTNKIFKKF
ncbi:porin [Limibacter armeniacum]|uniref:porin n=1 Tax=Limibacter armeniacum TaxID=466084 RepID=UPI002FE5459A